MKGATPVPGIKNDPVCRGPVYIRLNVVTSRTWRAFPHEIHLNLYKICFNPYEIHLNPCKIHCEIGTKAQNANKVNTVSTGRALS